MDESLTLPRIWIGLSTCPARFRPLPFLIHHNRPILVYQNYKYVQKLQQRTPSGACCRNNPNWCELPSPPDGGILRLVKPPVARRKYGWTNKGEDKVRKNILTVRLFRFWPLRPRTQLSHAVHQVSGISQSLYMHPCPAT